MSLLLVYVLQIPYCVVLYMQSASPCSRSYCMVRSYSTSLSVFRALALCCRPLCRSWSRSAAVAAHRRLRVGCTGIYTRTVVLFMQCTRTKAALLFKTTCNRFVDANTTTGLHASWRSKTKSCRWRCVRETDFSETDCNFFESMTSNVRSYTFYSKMYIRDLK